jgi:hypothetical protein
LQACTTWLWQRHQLTARLQLLLLLLVLAVQQLGLLLMQRWRVDQSHLQTSSR